MIDLTDDEDDKPPPAKAKSKSKAPKLKRVVKGVANIRSLSRPEPKNKPAEPKAESKPDKTDADKGKADKKIVIDVVDDKPKESKRKNETITDIPIAAPKKTQKRLSQNEEDAQEIARAIKKAARGVKHIPIPPGVETFFIGEDSLRKRNVKRLAESGAKVPPKPKRQRNRKSVAAVK